MSDGEEACPPPKRFTRILSFVVCYVFFPSGRVFFFFFDRDVGIFCDVFLVFGLGAVGAFWSCVDE